MLDLMRMFGELNSMPTTPRMNIDILDKEDHYEIHADLPGYAKEDISIEYNDCMLTISAEQKMNTKETKNDYICSEMYQDPFVSEKSIQLRLKPLCRMEHLSSLSQKLKKHQRPEKLILIKKKRALPSFTLFPEKSSFYF